MVDIFRYTTLGTPVPHPDYPEYDCGYDDCREGFVITWEGADFCDLFDPESTTNVKLVATIETLGM